MNTTAIYIKTDPEVKERAQEVASELGLSLSAILNAYLKQFIKTKTVTFSTLDEVPNTATQAIMKRAGKNYKAGNTSPVFDNAKEMDEWFDKQGI